jgi:hypothetical protein
MGKGSVGWLLAVGFMTLGSDWAAAQPSALFPDIYIHRQRPCAANEDPRYQYYRENYFGYFPTCWRRFPNSRAWNCPSPEAPNWEEALRQLPLEIPPDFGMEATPGEGESGMEAPGREPDPFARPAPRSNLDRPELPELPDDDPLFRRPGAEPGADVEPPGTAPDPFRRSSTRDPGAAGSPANGVDHEPSPVLAPPTGLFPGTPAAHVHASRDEQMQRAARVAPRRGLLGRLLPFSQRR